MIAQPFKIMKRSLFVCVGLKMKHEAHYFVKNFNLSSLQTTHTDSPDCDWWKRLIHALLCLNAYTNYQHEKSLPAGKLLVRAFLKDILFSIAYFVFIFHHVNRVCLTNCVYIQYIYARVSWVVPKGLLAY